MELYFLDTYALYELFVGNAGYKRFEKGVAVITTRLNLMEFYYTLLRTGVENPDLYYERLLNVIIEVSDKNIKDAMRFRLRNKLKNLSYVDAIGYIIALDKNAGFVTGDVQFKDVEGVVFVK
ncbi:PIN domain-containing protein [Candidatus Woesearchaeota archaeon]|nr:PIN domain-containing protein [Candidatus Woesearchaeota archaeon]